MQKRWSRMLILLIVWNCNQRYNHIISIVNFIAFRIDNMIKVRTFLLASQLLIFLDLFQLKRLKHRKNNWDSDTYEFDEVFTEFASQKRVYEVVARPVVEVITSLTYFLNLIIVHFLPISQILFSCVGKVLFCHINIFS